MTSSKGSFVTMEELKNVFIAFEKESAETYAALRSLTEDQNAAAVSRCRQCYGSVVTLRPVIPCTIFPSNRPGLRKPVPVP